MAETIRDYPDTGLRAIELYYEPVMNMEYYSVEAYRSQLRINSPDIGVILPEQYLPVSQRTVQASRLSMWALSHAIEDIARLETKGILLEWVSVYVPIRLLLSEDFPEKLSSMVATGRITPKRLCLEIPGEVLFEDSDEVSQAFEKIRSIGSRTMICDYGGEFCPLLRLARLRPDFVMTDQSVTADAICNDECRIEFARSVFSMVNSAQAKVIAKGVNKDNKDIMSQLCDFSIGKLAGRIKKISGIRS